MFGQGDFRMISLGILFYQDFMEKTFSGWWYNYPSEKYESQLGLLFPIYGNIKHVPNHQPVFMFCLNMFMTWVK
jgi:hypothetical protein